MYWKYSIVLKPKFGEQKRAANPFAFKGFDARSFLFFYLNLMRRRTCRATLLPYTFLSVCQLCRDLFPGHAFFCHQHHHMVQEISDFIFDFVRIGVFCCDDDFCRLFPDFL